MESPVTAMKNPVVNVDILLCSDRADQSAGFGLFLVINNAQQADRSIRKKKLRNGVISIDLDLITNRVPFQIALSGL